MSIASRIEAIEQHLTDDYSVLTLAGADLTNVDKNILNLKSTWQERLLYFMNNGTDVVWNNWDKVTGEGTILTLNNTEEAPMKINLKGNTSQNTTTGKNLLDITLTSQTKNGVNITVNEDNSITLSGTANSGLTLNLNYTSGKYINLTSGETYTISIKNNNGVYLRLAKVSDNSNVVAFDSPRTNVTFTSNYTGDCFVYLAILNNTTFNNLTIYPMVEKGPTTTDYEPYTNGASPNPDYPQDIHVVSGDNSIVVGNGTQSTSYPINLGDIELCKIGDYQDYIYKDNGKWYKHSEIGEYIFQTTVGTNTWYVQGTTNYQLTLSGINRIHLRASNQGLCNYFRIGSNGNDVYLYPILQAGVDYLRVSNATNKWETIDDFKSFITNNQVKYIYVLDTPTYTEITDSTLISQLEAIKEAESYSGQTNISQVNNDLPFIISATALKEMS